MAGITEWVSRKAGLSQQEAKGAVVLLCAICITLFVPIGLSAYYGRIAHAEHAALLSRIDSLLKASPELTTVKMEQASFSTAASSFENAAVAKDRRTLKPIDPNTATAEELEAIGVPEFLAKRINHYVAAGGKFHKPDDLKKIYGFKPGLYDAVKPYIRINGSVNSPQKYEKRTAKKPTQLDVNEADSASLEALPGIGDFTARSIVKYRKLLGGFVDMNQLYELYHQDSARTKMFSKFLYIKAGYEPEKLRINTADQVRLYHPYMSKSSAKLISAYVKQNGYLSSWEDLRTKKLVSDEELEKLRPYLSFN